MLKLRLKAELPMILLLRKVTPSIQPWNLKTQTLTHSFNIVGWLWHASSILGITDQAGNKTDRIPSLIPFIFYSGEETEMYVCHVSGANKQDEKSKTKVREEIMKVGRLRSFLIGKGNIWAEAGMKCSTAIHQAGGCLLDVWRKLQGDQFWLKRRELGVLLEQGMLGGEAEKLSGKEHTALHLAFYSTWHGSHWRTLPKEVAGSTPGL